MKLNVKLMDVAWHRYKWQALKNVVKKLQVP
jgi:hypothetical protein